MDKNEIEGIVRGLGGLENIDQFGNCMTRLRLTVKDERKVNVEALKKAPGVVGFVGGAAQPQIVLGPGKAEEAKAQIQQMLAMAVPVEPKLSSDVAGYASKGNPDGEKSARVENFNKKKKNRSQIFTTISQVFTPLIPALAGTGLLYGVMKILSLFYIYGGVQLFNGAAIADGGSYLMAALSVIAGSFFSVMNIAVAGSASTVVGGNLFVGLAVGGIVTNVGGLEGLSMGFLNLKFTSGMGGTLAALFGGLLAGYIDKKMRERTPSSLQIHLPALVSVALTGLVLLFVIQPITGVLANGITEIVMWLTNDAGAFGGAILSGTFLPLVALGIHHIFTPIHTTLLQTLGYTSIAAFSSLAGAGLAGAAVGLIAKYRNTKYHNLTHVVWMNIPTQLLGISEPMIYGVTLPLWRPFIAANLGGAVGGFVLGLFPGQGAEALNVSGLLGILVNTKPFAYILGYGASVLAAALFTYYMGVKEEYLEPFLDKEFK
ncbi:PTS transporter subunit EIIC [Lacticaseibacillus absianus]|uniref:PTS transporter subunit EIIC n=1 Tax=Lacticaseibacillus absianus TaxID=2729623 RepID=UPI0015CEED65|nr:PTS transporter subunit EIIC [Lacticaseibacillus absianus]